MAYAKNIFGSQGKIGSLSNKSVKYGSEFEGEKGTLFSKSTKIHEDSEFTNSQELKIYTSSIESLNKLSIGLSKNNSSQEDAIFGRVNIEEEKDDDFERDLDMDIDECPYTIPAKQRRQKNMPLRRHNDNFHLEKRNHEDDNISISSNKVIPGLRKSEIVYSHQSSNKRLRMRKIKSDVNTKKKSDNKFSSVFHENPDIGLYERDLNQAGAFDCLMKSPKKRDSKLFEKRAMNPELKYASDNCILFGDLATPTLALLENANFMITKPQLVLNTEMIDENLYRYIDIDQEYSPDLDTIDSIDRRNPSMESISCHTVS